MPRHTVSSGTCAIQTTSWRSTSVSQRSAYYRERETCRVEDQAGVKSLNLPESRRNTPPCWLLLVQCVLCFMFCTADVPVDITAVLLVPIVPDNSLIFVN